jgi:hypothetical protein
VASAPGRGRVGHATGPTSGAKAFRHSPDGYRCHRDQLGDIQWTVSILTGEDDLHQVDRVEPKSLVTKWNITLERTGLKPVRPQTVDDLADGRREL